MSRKYSENWNSYSIDLLVPTLEIKTFPQNLLGIKLQIPLSFQLFAIRCAACSGCSQMSWLCTQDTFFWWFNGKFDPCTCRFAVSLFQMNSESLPLPFTILRFIKVKSRNVFKLLSLTFKPTKAISFEATIFRQF